MRKNVYYKTDRGQRLGAGRHATKASREAIHVTKGDTVRVMRGDDKGKEGKVLQVYPKTGRIKVDGINIVKRHRKARRPEEQSGIIEMAAPFHASNVMLLDTKTGRVLVEGINIVKKHRRARRPEEQSGIIEAPAPIAASNVMLLDPKTGAATRTRRRIDADGTKARVSAKSGEPIAATR